MNPSARELHVVTGAFGYSGKYIASRLLQAGHRVRTLTNSPDRPNPFDGKIETRPLSFDDKTKLTESLRGASVFYNTYWVRFNHRDFFHHAAVQNTLALFEACQTAGVSRVVHVSITNPSADSQLSYFRGKALLEQALTQSGLSYAILRPAVLFGPEDILVNNIAWVLRRFPVFAVFGSGEYKLQPIYVDDLAQLAVRQGGERANRIIDAIGPETFTYRDLVRQLGEIIGKPRPVFPLPPALGCLAGLLMGKVMGDVLLTRDEIRGLMANLLCTDSPPAGTVRLTDWARHYSPALGRRYASELARRRNRRQAYDRL
jgi:NADH dehydrogenase